MLTSDALHLVCAYEYFLLDGLHGEDLLGQVVLHHVDFAVGATADGLQDAEVTLGHACLH